VFLSKLLEDCNVVVAAAAVVAAVAVVLLPTQKFN